MLTMVTMLQLHMCSNITVQVFSALTTLRKLCNHPDLVTNDYSEQLTLSGGNKKKKKASQIADTPKANIKSKHFTNMDPNPHTHTHTPTQLLHLHHPTTHTVTPPPPHTHIGYRSSPCFPMDINERR